MVNSIVNHAHHKEHASRRNAVSDHLEHGTIQAHLPVLRVHRLPGLLVDLPDCQTQQHITHVTHGAVCDQAFEVGLRKRGESTINNANHTNRHHGVS